MRVVLSIDVSAPEGGVVGVEQSRIMAFPVAFDADEYRDFEDRAIAILVDVAGAMVFLCEP